MSSLLLCCVFFFKQKTAYEMRISDWSSDVCSSDLCQVALRGLQRDRGGHDAGDMGDVAADDDDRPDLGDGAAEAGEQRGQQAVAGVPQQIGRASGRERGCQSV